MDPAVKQWALAPVVAGLAALGVVACGGSSPTPTPTTKPSPSPTALSLGHAVLDTGDFSAGATTGDAKNVPDLTNIKCTPDQTSGLQQQYKSDVKAASGREYGNVVVAFDTASDAHTFVTTFSSDAQSCSDAASAPVADNFGTYSFYFKIASTPNDLLVEAVQLDRYATVLIQYVPQGGQSDQQSLRDLTQASVNKLENLSS
jgi:hypothetical protein